MPRVSIIIPVYNVIQYLDRCLESVAAQTFPDYEVILVDDGSTDGSDTRCDQWAERDTRIRVIHKENSGQSAARNTGVSVACSSLITFIDSDDTVSPYYLEYHLKALEDLKADCVFAAYRRITEQDSIDSVAIPSYSARLWSRAEALHEMAARELRANEWNILAPKSWYLEEPLPVGVLYEDRAHVHKLLLKASRVAFVDAVLYYYLIRNNSTLYAKTSSIRLCRDFQSAIKTAYTDMKSSGLVSDEDLSLMLCRDCISLYLTARRCREAPDESEQIGKWALAQLQQNWNAACRNQEAPVSVRMRIGLMHVSPRLYQKLDRFVKQKKGWTC